MSAKFNYKPTPPWPVPRLWLPPQRTPTPLYAR